MNKASIIIRTFNESRWISECLKSVMSQDYGNFEIIIVDNNSTDHTLELVKNYDLKIININNFLPGKALNRGIENSSGDYIICLSGHCIPKSNKWLSHLVFDLQQKDVAATYGRQEPLSITPDSDKRDLMITFGLDKKIQIKDTFFHNANSALKRSIWNKIPFDSEVTNIEDRIWAEEIISMGYKIIYEPEASVYHYHGIHQDGNKKRLRQVVKILEQNNVLETNTRNESEVCAIVPIDGKANKLSTTLTSLAYTYESIKSSKNVSKCVLIANDDDVIQEGKNLGFELIDRPDFLSAEYITVMDVIKYSVEEMSINNYNPEMVIYASSTYPFRPRVLFDEIIEQMKNSEFTSIIPSITEYRSVWGNKNDEIIRFDEGSLPHDFKKGIEIGIAGLGAIYSVHAMMNNYLDEKIGLYKINEFISQVDIQNHYGRDIANDYLDKWWLKNYEKKND